ncbi:MAG TPA: Holliday junction branch migration protein RuvA, partial [Ruminococcus sp.]|nr:Holliday junction branch migration protein RuvA [Ruminococcus sp.]
SALTVLGYSNAEIMPVISKLDASLPSSELIKLALKAIASAKFS